MQRAFSHPVQLFYQYSVKTSTCLNILCLLQLLFTGELVLLEDFHRRPPAGLITRQTEPVYSGLMTLKKTP